MTHRGYAAIGLFAPSKEVNVSGAMRAAYCYGAGVIIIQGRYHRYGADTTAAYRHIPTIVCSDILSNIPYDCVPVAIEIVEGARELPSYTHPERAFYIFGPEGGSLPARVLDHCRDVVKIPTCACMNLAATVNVVLYDRVAKCER